MKMSNPVNKCCDQDTQGCFVCKKNDSNGHFCKICKKCDNHSNHKTTNSKRREPSLATQCKHTEDLKQCRKCKQSKWCYKCRKCIVSCSTNFTSEMHETYDLKPTIALPRKEVINGDKPKVSEKKSINIDGQYLIYGNKAIDGTLRANDFHKMRMMGMGSEETTHIIEMSYMIHPYDGLFSYHNYSFNANIGCRGIYKIYDKYYKFIISSNEYDLSKCALFLSEWEKVFLNFSKQRDGFEVCIDHENLIHYACLQEDKKVIIEMIKNLSANSPEKMIGFRADGAFHLTHEAYHAYNKN